MDGLMDKFPFKLTDEEIAKGIEAAKAEAALLKQDKDVLKLLFNCIDLTSLNTEDSSDSIRDFVEKVNELPKHFSLVPQVAAMCVYPAFASVLKSGLQDKNIGRAVVSAGFPSSQTYLDVKKLETQRAIDFGANEIDIVISVGEFLEGNYEFVGEEITAIKSVMGDAHLKVILESGALKEPNEIWTASIIAMEYGGDFIKTSTGKQQPAATFEAAFTMLSAIKSFHTETGKKIGFKPAGGISTAEDALVYYCLVKQICGDDWLNNKLFRIGASRLANNLLSDVAEIENGFRKEIKYF
ncbi:deoxyribose-phosphate aldolase [Carboxylicivirga marina]|uniref:deoxyribose-phosphate aldolase n=1 Tax=Carboxylicivirga marina TaxID=2800988 RepID=UPI002598ECCC|nr:deoxyribose-phosphate aldolase [uncultured Carboxylicivirga sp.]